MNNFFHSLNDPANKTKTCKLLIFSKVGDLDTIDDKKKKKKTENKNNQENQGWKMTLGLQRLQQKWNWNIATIKIKKAINKKLGINSGFCNYDCRQNRKVLVAYHLTLDVELSRPHEALLPTKTPKVLWQMCPETKSYVCWLEQNYSRIALKNE